MIEPALVVLLSPLTLQRTKKICRFELRPMGGQMTKKWDQYQKDRNRKILERHTKRKNIQRQTNAILERNKYKNARKKRKVQIGWTKG